jgi:tetratricopeptide (TPR) repeat protein
MYAAQNDVSGFFWGAYFGGGTMALLTDYSITQYNPNNRFTDNSLGIAAAWGSYVLTYPNNSIYNNNSYDAYATNSGELYAQNNYWGGSSANKYADGTSTIDAANYLVDDPWDGYSAIASTGELTPKEFNKKETLNSSSQETGEGSPFINNFLTGLNLEKEGKINDAIAHYKQMINNETSARFALLALAKISVRYSKHDLLNYFKELLSNPNKSRYQSTIQNLLASIHLQKGNYSAAMNYYDEIIKDNSSRYEAANARFEKFFAALHIKKDKELAGKLLSEIQSAATDFTNEDFLMRLETAEYLLHGPEYNVSPAQTLSKENTNTTNSELPEEYALFGNYPNPFNPGTTISYTLPYQSEVEIIVYDIMGREIRTFNTVQAAGTQNTYWDGLNANGESISSGIYFYRLKFKSLETGDLFETVSKMMLLK